jgi:hypothetical protein
MFSVKLARVSDPGVLLKLEREELARLCNSIGRIVTLFSVLVGDLESIGLIRIVFFP